MVYGKLVVAGTESIITMFRISAMHQHDAAPQRAHSAQFVSVMYSMSFVKQLATANRIQYTRGDNLRRQNAIPKGVGGTDWPITIRRLPSPPPSHIPLTWHWGTEVVSCHLRIVDPIVDFSTRIVDPDWLKWNSNISLFFCWNQPYFKTKYSEF
jgi:hypothetical protein